MRHEKSYWQLLVAIPLSWVVLFAIPTFIEMYHEDEAVKDKFYASLPPVSVGEMKHELAELEKLAENPSSDPNKYFDLLKRIRDFERICMKEDRASGSVEVRQMYLRARGVTQTAHERYHEKHSSEVMQKVADSYHGMNPGFARDYTTFAPSADFGPHLVRLYYLSIPFAFLFLVVRLEACGFSVFLELVQTWRIAAATAFWPVGIFKYPTGDPAKQMVYALRLAALTLGSLLSFGALKVKASEHKPGENGDEKESDPWSLQVDGRISTEGGPNPEGFIRFTPTAPNGAFLETVTVARPHKSSYKNDTVLGVALLNSPSVLVNGIAGARITSSPSSSSRSGLLGVQFFLNTPRLSLQVPVLRYERRITPSSASTFAFVAMPALKFGRYAMGGEVLIRKTSGTPLVYSVGPRVGMKVGRASFVDVGAFLDDTHEWRVRGRVVKTFSFGPRAAVSDPPPSGPEFTTTIGATAYSKYVASIGFTPHDHPVIQPNIHVSHNASGLYLDLWSSVSPRGGLNSDFGDEFDASVGVRKQIGHASVDVGYSYFDLYNLKTIRGDLHDAYLEVGGPGRLAPYIKIDWLLPETPRVLEGGLAYRFGVRPSILNFGADVSLAGHDGVVGNRVERLSSARATISRAFKIKGFDVTPKITYQQHLGAPGGIAKNKLRLGLDLFRSF